jgi:cytoskeletal protein CcmA (bactofilin family)
MFTKKPEKDAASMDISRSGMSPNRPNGPPQVPGARAAGAQRGTASGTASTIGADLSITGNLESKGEIQIEGEVQGDVHAARIVIGERARITGALVADEIVVRGTVQGSIRGNNVTFQAASHIEADVFHRSLAIEQGAYFEGKSRRSDDPLSVQLRASNGLPMQPN